MKPESKTKLKRLRKEACERIAARGKLEFRADKELINSVLTIAAKQRQAVGPMIRQWVKERAEAESAGRPLMPEKLDKIDEKLERLCAALVNLLPFQDRAKQRPSKGLSKFKGAE